MGKRNFFKRINQENLKGLLMQLDNCPECGRLFVKKHEKCCPACIKNSFVEIQSIKGWIATTKEPHLNSIEKDINVPVKKFLEYLQKERFKTFGKVKANCEVCGRSFTIKTRHMVCSICLENIVKSNGGIHSHFYSREDDE
jgi:rubrerythrin